MSAHTEALIKTQSLGGHGMRAETDGAEHDRQDDEEGACAESDGAGHGTASRIFDNVPSAREFPADERASRPFATGLS